MKAVLNELVEMLRTQLVQLAMEQNSFVDRRVVALSQKLDRALLMLHRVNEYERLSKPNMPASSNGIEHLEAGRSRKLA